MLSAIADCSWLTSHRDLLERYRECKSAQEVKQVQDAILAELEEDAARRKDALMAYGEDLLVPNPNHSVLEDD
jgi:pre-rRNA-processing protein TSR3